MQIKLWAEVWIFTRSGAKLDVSSHVETTVRAQNFAPGAAKSRGISSSSHPIQAQRQEGVFISNIDLSRQRF
jgi:hypothetical protein